MSARSNSKPIRRGGGRPKIDWLAARRYFVRNPEVGFRDVARKYAVSDAAVRKHAKDEGWEERRNEVLAALKAKGDAEDVPTLEARQRQTIRVAERLRKVALNDKVELDIHTAVRVLPHYAKLEQLFEGEATDRIAFDDLQAFMRAVRDELLPIVGAERAEALAEALLRAAASVNAQTKEAVSS